MTIWSVHGFLGLPSDFDLVKSKCLSEKPDLQWISVDYNHARELSPSNTLKEWGAHFNQWVQKKGDSERILVGYSQGGRLGLHALKDNPGLWKAAILLSPNPGIREGEKPFRKQTDEEWAERFLSESFQKLVNEWNSQSVFKGSLTEPERKEENYNRHHLADALTRWSVAEQEDFREFLAHASVPILYVAGDQDSKYCQIGQSLKLANPRMHFEIIPNCSHRILFDQPDLLSEAIMRFLRKI